MSAQINERRTGVPRFHEDRLACLFPKVGVRFIEPVRQNIKQFGSDKSDPYIKSNILNKIVLNFEL